MLKLSVDVSSMMNSDFSEYEKKRGMKIEDESRNRGPEQRSETVMGTPLQM